MTDDKIRIRKSRKVPEKPRQGRPRKYPLPDLKVGENFFAPRCLVQTMISCIGFYRRRHAPDRAFIVKAEGVGVRVWRTK